MLSNSEMFGRVGGASESIVFENDRVLCANRVMKNVIGIKELSPYMDTSL